MDPKLGNATNNLEQWKIDDVNASSNYCFYQQRYPIRLPKLTTVPKSSTNNLLHDCKSKKNKLVYKTKVPSDEKTMTRQTVENNTIFSKRPLQEIDKGKIIKETEKLHLEDFIEDDNTTVETSNIPEKVQGASKDKVFTEKYISRPKTTLGNTSNSPNQNLSNQIHGSIQRNSRFRDLVTSKLMKASSDKTRLNYSEIGRMGSEKVFFSNNKTSSTIRNPSRGKISSKLSQESFLKIVKGQSESSAITNIKKSIKETNYSCRQKTRQNLSFNKNKMENGKSKTHYSNYYKQSQERKPIGNGAETPFAPSSELELVQIDNPTKNQKDGEQKEKVGKIREKQDEKEKNLEEILDKSEVKEMKENQEIISTKDKKKGQSIQPVGDSDENELLKYSSQWCDKLEPDEQMVLLADYSSTLLPKRDELDHLRGLPITFETAKNLRLLLFGSVSHSFNRLWREQTLVYHKINHYGLRFFKGGPTELMASLQAYVLKYMLFLSVDTTSITDLAERLSPNEDIQQRCLILAISDMIWKCGEKKHAVVALPTGNSSFVGDCYYREDRITEKMELFKFTNSDDLEKFIRRNIYLFQNPTSCGCISLLYSMMLSRGISRLRNDFSTERCGILEKKDDDPTFHSQILVNLAICGCAVPNVYNHDIEVYNEVEDQFECHKGISTRNEFGYLDYSEFVDSKELQVGSCLKTPLYPIWIAKHDGRLCVLFCLKKDLLNDWKLERRFQLYHYQGIPRYVEVVDVDVKLTIDTILPYPINIDDEEEPSQLEETIKTKWSDAVIDWNGHPRF